MLKRTVLFATTALVASLALTATAQAGPLTNHSDQLVDAAAVTPGSGSADQVIQWNQELVQLIQLPGAQPATVQPTRTLAITQLAVFNAVEAVEGRHGFDGYHGRGASAAAAVAAAAHTALVALLPSQQQALDARFQQSLSQIGSGSRVRKGIGVGERAARTILAQRANDGAAATPPVYQPLPGPGEYQLTPPAFTPAVFTHWAMVRPFVLDSASQFRTPPPPTVTSARYTDDFNEVKSIGELNSTTRSAEQTTIGRFWSAASVWNVWNQAAQTAGMAFHNSLESNARMFAQLDVSLADGVIALYDSKYTYHAWRPVTATRAADTDGNPDTAGNPTWAPLTNTAPDPSYPGAHAEISQSAAAALRDFFGTDRLDFSLTVPSMPGVLRSFQSFSQAANEASASRVFAGQHFRYDEEAGQALGDQVADFVASHGFNGQR